MKWSFIIIVLQLLVGCQSNDGYVIKGELAGAPENEWIYLMDVDQHQYYDSVQLHDGRFEFRGKVNLPELRKIIFYKDPTQRIYGWANILCIPVYVENSEILVSIPFAEMPSKLAKKVPASLRIEGSGVHDLYQGYIQQIEPLNLKFDGVFDQYRQVYYRGKGSEQDVIKCVKEMDMLRDSIYHYGVDFIRKHGDSPVATYVVNKLAVERYGREEAQRVLELFSPQVRTGEMGEQLEKTLIGKTLYVNDMMPDFLVLDINLNEKRLSECVHKGRYTLVELWASWCGPCRHDIPRLKETYKRFHEKGFDIVSVSIDDEMDKWKSAVSREGMEWTQVCGAKGVKYGKECMQAFGVNAVPSGFLIDPQGKVIDVAARGGWLNMKLIELFGE